MSENTSESVLLHLCRGPYQIGVQNDPYWSSVTKHLMIIGAVPPSADGAPPSGRHAHPTRPVRSRPTARQDLWPFIGAFDSGKASLHWLNLAGTPRKQSIRAAVQRLTNECLISDLESAWIFE
jgi:hypothetical protein